MIQTLTLSIANCVTTGTTFAPATTCDMPAGIYNYTSVTINVQVNFLYDTATSSYVWITADTISITASGKIVASGTSRFAFLLINYFLSFSHNYMTKISFP